MRTLYGSTSWRRVLALVLVFVMMVSTMGTSGYSVFAEDLVETNEEVTVSEPEAVTPEVTVDDQGPSPGEEESEAVVDPATDAEPVEASEDGEEPAADSELVETSEEGEEPAEEVAEPVEETEEGEEPADAETVEETEEGEEPADAETVEETEEAEPVEPAEETLISEAAQVIAEDDGEAVAEPVEAVEELPEELIEEPVVIAMPAIDAEKLFDDARVTVSAPEGAFPEGTTVNIEEVTLGRTQSAAIENAVEAKVVSYKAYDITFNNGDQTDMQPADGYTVKVNIEPYSMPEAENLQVVHMETVRKAEIIDATVTDAGLEFDAEHFSIYAVVTTGDDARIKVTFVQADGEVSMYVKKGDNMEQVLYDPGAGELAEDEGEYFRGWTTDKNYTTDTKALTIAEVRAAVADMLPPSTDGTEVKYYAMLFKDYRITYFDENDISLGQEEVTFRADSTETEQSYTVNMGYTVPSDTQHFEGWNVKEGGSNITSATFNGDSVTAPYENNTVLTIKGNVDLSVNAPKGHWFIFDQNGDGATYNAPQFVHSNDKPTRPNDSFMKRSGYTFGGWYATKAIADTLESTEPEYDFNNTLSDKVTVYARWIPNETAGYTVLIWKQNIACTDYDFEEAINLEGTVDSVIDTVKKVGTGDAAYATVNEANKRYTGFHLKEFDQNVTIKTEGNSVVNVFYDRTEYTLTFQAWGVYTYTPTTDYDWRETYYGLVNGEYIQITRYQGSWYYYDYGWTAYSGTRYTRSGSGNRWTTVKTITAKYGQDISSNFPISGYVGHVWRPQNSSVYTSGDVPSIEQMREENTVFHAVEYGQGTTAHLYYYTEAMGNEPSGTTTVQYDGKTYVEHQHVQINADGGIGSTEAEDFIDIAGYAHKASDPAYVNGRASLDESNDYTIKFYYTRKYYTINFMDGKYVDGNNEPTSQTSRGQLSISDSILYGGDASSYNNYKAEDYTPKGYVFEGWFIDEACTQPFTFTTMPEGGLTVYAKWRQKQYRVFLHVNYPEGATGNINWGTNNQQMTFRISEGGHVSEPTGKGLAGFEFVGWYLDKDCTQVFNGEAYTINEDTVKTPYDKTVDMTDTYDSNGNLIDPKKNTDIDRFWITYKLDIYAKWRATLDGASGIVVEYDAANGTGAPTDNNTYVDDADAPAGAASKSADSDKVFGYWIVQKWNGTAWEDTNTKVLPGGTFKVLASNAKVEDIANPSTGGDTKKYTVRLKAFYIDSEHPTPTHIYWYKNTGEDAYRKDDNLEINVGVDIPEAPTREGYTFLGWARINTSTSNDPAQASAEAAVWESTESNWTQENPSLYLYYNEDGTYHLNSASGTAVTQVAADEDRPYQAMFAVWEESLSIRITGNQDTLTYNGKEQKVTGYKVEFKIGEAEWTETVPTGVTVTYASEEAAALGTNVGQYSMNLAKQDFTINAGNYGFDSESNLTITDGKLTISPAPVTVKAENKTKAFGENDPELTATVTGLVNNESEDLISYEISRAPGENPGTYTITPSGAETQGNYTVTYQTGTLTINPAGGNDIIPEPGTDGDELDANGKSLTVVYDGKVHSIKATATIEGSKIEYKAVDSTVWSEIAPTLTNVGEITFSIRATKENYETVTKDGYLLKVTPAPVTVKADDKTKKFGENDPTLTATVTGMVNNESAEQLITYTISRAEGETVEGSPYTITPSGEQNQGNYEVTFQTGTLTISKGTGNEVTPDRDPDDKNMTVEGNNLTVVYDGKVHTASAKATKEGSTIYYQYDNGDWTTEAPTRTVVGETSFDIKATHPDYDDVYARGCKLIVTPAPVTVKADDKTKKFGENDPALTATVTGMVNNESAEQLITYTISRAEGEDVGRYTITPAGEKTQGNYEVTFQTGTLTISKGTGNEVTPDRDPDDKNMTVEGNNLTVVYDGKVHTASAKATKEGSTIYYQYDNGDWTTKAPTRTVVGETSFDIKATHPDYDDVYARGCKLIVTPAPVTVKADDKTKKFGKNDPALTATVTGMVNNESAEQLITYTISRAEGEEIGSYTVTPSGEKTQGNYEVTFQTGTLTIEEAEPVTYTIIYHANYESALTGEGDEVITKIDATSILGYSAVGFIKHGASWRNGNTTYTFAGWYANAEGTGDPIPEGLYDGKGAVLEGQTSGNDQQPATNEAGAVNTATSSLRSGLRMAFTTSFGGTLELWAKWTASTSGNGGGTRPPREPDPTDEPEEPIDDPDTPLAPGTIDEPEEPIDDPDTPLAPYEEETEIDDEATPLTPFTGDDRHTDVWAFLSVLSLAGIVLLGRKRREEE